MSSRREKQQAKYEKVKAGYQAAVKAADQKQSGHERVTEKPGEKK